jgi:ribosomal-protein-alanine N-acetyltransferase
MTTIPAIETDNLLLRPFVLADADAYYAAVLGDAEVMRRSPIGMPVPAPRARSIIEDHRDLWATHGFGLWAVTLRADETLIGHCGLQPLDHKPEQIELTCLMGRQYRRYTVEAVDAVLRYALRERELPRVVAVIRTEDRGTGAALEAAGLAYERMIRAYDQYMAYFSIDQGQYTIDPARHWRLIHDQSL